MTRLRRSPLRRVTAFAWPAALLAWVLLAIGCASRPTREPLELATLPVVAQPGLSSPVEIPLQVVGGLVLVDVIGRDGPWRFLVDTGASTTLVSPEFAIRHLRKPLDPNAPKVWLRDASGRAVPAESVLLDVIDFGVARFQNARAVVFDCREISDHLGVQIDGVVGFNLFRNARLTIDYPQRRLVMSTAADASPLVGSIVPYTSHNDVPLIQASLGGRTLVTLIDTGSDGHLNLDPGGLDLEFASPPRQGTVIGTLHGDHPQVVGRLAGNLTIGEHTIERPIADLSGQLTSIGGGILQHFAVTFDPSRRVVAFHRPEPSVGISTPPLISTGLGFRKSRAYWRINGVAPGSPAAQAGLAVGDLVIRINGEPVENWDLARFTALVDSGGVIDYTLIKGRDELTRRAGVFALVP